MPSPKALGQGREQLGPDLRTRLLWFTLFRVAANSLSLAAIALRVFAERPRELSTADLGAFATIGVIYILTLAYSFRLRFSSIGRVDAVAQVAGDLLIATALVFLTGGAESPFTFTYSVAVIGAALVLGFRASLWSSAAAFLLYALVALAVQSSLVVPPIEGGVLPTSRLLYLLVTHGLSVTLIGTLAGYLSGQLAQAGGRLVESQKDLRSLAGLHAQILEAMPSGLLTADPERRITFANPTALSILSAEERNLIGESLDEVMQGFSTLGENVARRELAVSTSAGRKVLGLSVAPLVAEPGAVLLVFQDLTELRRLETKLQRADRLAALGQMAAQLAHEIRNPLASMRGSAQLIAQEPTASSASTRLSQILVRESDRLGRLVDDVLKFSSPQEPKRQEVDLDALVRETVEMLRADSMTSDVSLQVNTVPLRALVDPDQIRQLLLNLIRNAIQAVGPEGRVRVDLLSEGDCFQVAIWDSAGAIDPATMGRMFEPFFSTRQGGTGLGLATSHAIVMSHGGEMEIHSSPENGTEVVARIPTQPARHSLTPIPESKQVNWARSDES